MSAPEPLKHAVFSASGAARWMACPASIPMSEPYRSDEATSSIYAAEGSAAHELAERALRDDLHGEAYIGQVIEHDGHAFTVDAEMAAYVQEYLDYVRALPGELFIEQRVCFDHVVPGGFGTADAIVYDAESHILHVVDLKYGQGVRVDAEDNPQAQLYAIGALSDFEWIGEIRTVHCVIVQPRLDHISEWGTTPAELKAFAKRAKAAADNALSSSPRFGPSEKACQFCPAAGECKALAQFNLAVACDDFDIPVEDSMTLRDIATMSGPEIAGILPHVKQIQDWLKAVESRAISEIDAGREVPGYKLVAGRSIRQWGDERDAEAALLVDLSADDVFTRRLISPTQAEKLLGKGHPLLDELVVKPAGKPTLVPESDKRPALPSSAERDFADDAE